MKSNPLYFLLCPHLTGHSYSNSNTWTILLGKDLKHVKFMKEWAVEFSFSSLAYWLKSQFCTLTDLSSNPSSVTSFVELTTLLLTLPIVTIRSTRNCIYRCSAQGLPLSKYMGNGSCHLCCCLTNAACTAASNHLGPIIYHSQGTEPSFALGEGKN